MGLASIAKVTHAVDVSLKCVIVGLPPLSMLHDGIGPDAVDVLRFSDLPRILPLPDSVDLVVAPLFCTDFDALELMEALGQKGFRGTLRVIAPKLPNRQIVQRELRTHAVRQGITLDLIEAV